MLRLCSCKAFLCVEGCVVARKAALVMFSVVMLMPQTRKQRLFLCAMTRLPVFSQQRFLCLPKVRFMRACSLGSVQVSFCLHGCLLFVCRSMKNVEALENSFCLLLHSWSDVGVVLVAIHVFKPEHKVLILLRSRRYPCNGCEHKV